MRFGFSNLMGILLIVLNLVTCGAESRSGVPEVAFSLADTSLRVSPGGRPKPLGNNRLPTSLLPGGRLKPLGYYTPSTTLSPGGTLKPLGYNRLPTTDIFLINDSLVDDSKRSCYYEDEAQEITCYQAGAGECFSCCYQKGENRSCNLIEPVQDWGPKVQQPVIKGCTKAKTERGCPPVSKGDEPSNAPSRPEGFGYRPKPPRAYNALASSDRTGSARGSLGQRRQIWPCDPKSGSPTRRAHAVARGSPSACGFAQEKGEGGYLPRDIPPAAALGGLSTVDARIQKAVSKGLASWMTDAKHHENEKELENHRGACLRKRSTRTVDSSLCHGEVAPQTWDVADLRGLSQGCGTMDSQQGAPLRSPSPPCPFRERQGRWQCRTSDEDEHQHAALFRRDPRLVDTLWSRRRRRTSDLDAPPCARRRRTRALPWQNSLREISQRIGYEVCKTSAQRREPLAKGAHGPSMTPRSCQPYRRHRKTPGRNRHDNGTGVYEPTYSAWWKVLAFLCVLLSAISDAARKWLKTSNSRRLSNATRQGRIFLPKVIQKRRTRHRHARLKHRRRRSRTASTLAMAALIIGAQVLDTSGFSNGRRRDSRWNFDPQQRQPRRRSKRRNRQMPYAAIRIGEASNPGPEFVTVRQLAQAAKLTRIVNKTIEESCRRNTAGSHGKADNKQDTYGLSVATANTTCWKSARKYLSKRAKAEVICLQEHKLCTKEELAEASQWCARNGWKSIWSPASPSSDGGEASGGTAIVARDHLGLTDAHSLLEPSDKACAAKLDFPGGRRTLVVSAYLKCSVGLNQENLRTLNAIGSAVTSWKGSAIVGGDFNNLPEDVAASGIAAAMGTVVVAPIAPRGTCASSLKKEDKPKADSDQLQADLPREGVVEEHPDDNHGNGNLARGGRIIDFFLVSKDMSQCIKQISVDYNSGLSPHRPVLLQFDKQISSLKARTLKLPPKIEPTTVLGPMFRANGWQFVHRDAAELLRQARSGQLSHGALNMMADEGMQKFADLAEQELEANTGCAIPKHGTRCRKPKVTWQSILREDTTPPAVNSAAAKWGRQAARDLASRPTGASSEWYSSLQNGWDKALKDAEGDDDLEKLLLRLGQDIIDAEGADSKWCQTRGLEHFDNFSAAVEQTTRREDHSGIKSWKEWLSSSEDKGHKRAHAFARLPVAWGPQETVSDEGVLTGDPSALLEGQRGKFKKLWAAGDASEAQERYDECPPRAQNPASEGRDAHATPLPRLSPKILRAAAKTFSPRTSSTFDGMHPRHFSALSDEALATLALLLEAAEEMGRWPPCISAVVTALIPKARGGVRPIGLFSGAYRLWARARRPEAAEWERRHHRQFFAAREGNGALDAVWTQAMRNEGGAHKKQFTASLLVDLASFYEHFNHDKLVERADRLGFPPKITRLALAGYRGARFISQRGKTTHPLVASRGVVAGCGFATTWVKVYCVEAFDKFKKRHPHINIDAYIDDITLSITTGDPKRTEDLLVAAAEDLARLIKEELDCEIAREKSVVICSDDAMAKRLADRLGCVGAVPAASASNLGVDFTCGRKRRTHKQSGVRAGRFARGKARISRLGKLKFAIGSKIASKVAASGAMRATEFGAAVNGLSDSEMDDLQRIALAGTSPGAKGRSRTAVMAILGDCTWEPATAPILQWVRTAWKGGSEADGQATLDELSTAWREAEDDRGNLIAHDGTRRWSQVRGPLGAMFLSLDRIGWYTCDGRTFLDDLGITRDIMSFTPAAWKGFLKASVQRMHERDLGLKTGYPELRGRRACVDVVRRVARSSKTPKEGARLLTTNACNGIWTKTRAKAAGYELEDSLCELCGLHEDTIHGRVWKCQHPPVKLARELAASPAIIRAALKAGPNCALYNRGIFAHPAEDYPEPAALSNTHCTQEGRVCPSANCEFRGKIFVDGSCDQHMINDLKRAGWGAVAIDERGEVVATARGVIPSDTTQSSQSGEYGALACVALLATGPARIFSDCLNVVKAWNAPSGKEDVRKAYGTYTRFAKHPHGDNYVESVEWIKAHQDLKKAAGDPTTLAHAKANDAADGQANEGRKMHPQPSPVQALEVKRLCWHATAACRAIAATLPLWPRLKHQQSRTARGNATGWAAEAPNRTEKHSWQTGRGGKPFCSKCLCFSRTEKPSLKRTKERCPGRADCLAEHGHLWGHEVLETNCGGTPLLICGTCGVWSEHMTRGLATPCRGTKGNQVKTSLKRTRGDGRHPLLKQDLEYAPRKYIFNEAEHGPSRRTTAIRRLTRRKLAGIVEWAEPESSSGDPAEAYLTDSGCPSAEEEARLYMEQEEYFAQLDDHPFSFGDENWRAYDDAADFWDEIPREALAAEPSTDEQPAELPPPTISDNELARELFGVNLDAARVSRRRATADAQGNRFWNNLEDCRAPTGRSIADLRHETVEELFSEGADDGVTSAVTDATRGEPDCPPQAHSPLSEPLRASIKLKRAAAIAKKRGKRDALPDTQRLSIASNKAAAEAKKRRIDKAKEVPAKPAWSIITATSELFGTSEGASSGPTLTASQQARVACSIAATASSSRTSEHPQTDATAAGTEERPTMSKQPAPEGGQQAGDREEASTYSREERPRNEGMLLGPYLGGHWIPSENGDLRAAAGARRTAPEQNIPADAPDDPADPTPTLTTCASVAAAAAPAAAAAATPAEAASAVAKDPAPTGESRTHSANKPDESEPEPDDRSNNTPAADPDRSSSEHSSQPDSVVEKLENGTEVVTKDPAENLGLRHGLPASRRNSQGAHNQVASFQNRKGRQDGARTPSCPHERTLPPPSAGGDSENRAEQTAESSADARSRSNSSSSTSSSSSSDTEEVVRDPLENPGLRLGIPASRRNSQGKADQVVSAQSPRGRQEVAQASPCPQDQMLLAPLAGGDEQQRTGTEGSYERRSQDQLNENDCKKRRVDTASSNTVGNSTASVDGTLDDQPASGSSPASSSRSQPEASTPAESRPPTCRPAGPKRVALAPGVFAPGPTQSAIGAPGGAFSGLGADAAPISPEEPAARAELSNQEQPYSDSSDHSDHEDAELSIDPDWEASFVTFLQAKRRRTEEKEFKPIPEHTDPSSAELVPHLSSDELSELVELARDGIPVCWPKGMDERIAKTILANR